MADALSKTSLKLPPRLWTEVKMRALVERRDAQELVAEALTLYLQDIAETGKAAWEDLEEAGRGKGQVFRGWKRGSRGRLVPVFSPIGGADK